MTTGQRPAGQDHNPGPAHRDTARGLPFHTLMEPDMDHPISAEAAAHVLFHFGEGGYQPGSFTTHLLSAFATADEDNFFRLASAFPEYGAAVAAIQYDPQGVSTLRKIAAGQVAA